MSPATEPPATGRHPDVALVDLSIVLAANPIDPTIINQDFLRYNGIVDAGLGTTEPPVSTPVFSQVIFENRLAVTADPNRVIFSHQGNPLSEDDCVSPRAASRFLETVPHAPYSAIGINPKCFRLSVDGHSDRVADVLIDEGKWMSFRDVLPDVHLKATYSYKERRITLDVGGATRKDSDGSEAPGLLFQVNIHRGILETDQVRRAQEMSSIIAAWRDDLSDFKNLVAKFNPERDTP